MEESFEWDPLKDLLNQMKHGVSFETAKKAFHDPRFVVVEDSTHSTKESRYHCYGKVDGRILTVRFTWRGKLIRIIGAGYWRYGRRYYEEKSSLHGRP